MHNARSSAQRLLLHPTNRAFAHPPPNTITHRCSTTWVSLTRHSRTHWALVVCLMWTRTLSMCTHWLVS